MSERMVTTEMARKPQTLDELRKEIDRIDDAIHDLLMRRAEVTCAVAAAKGPRSKGGVAPSMRPAREAQVLRRLIARHRGGLPAAVIVRIWREIIAASLQSQTKFHLHVFGGEHQGAFSDLAHAYFGASTPIRAHTRASMVVHACAEEPDSLGVVPLPETEEVDPWWAQLAPAGQAGPRVVARLPFLRDGQENAIAAYVIGPVEQEPSGDDTTLLRLETAGGLSRTRLVAILKEAGLEAGLIAAGKPRGNDARGIALVAAKGFVAASDPRLAALLAGAGEAIARVEPVGGFANPLFLAQEAAP